MPVVGFVQEDQTVKLLEGEKDVKPFSFSTAKCYRPDYGFRARNLRQRIS